MLPEQKIMEDWLVLSGHADVPALRHTAQALERFRGGQNRLNASSIANILADDPLMTVKLLRYMQKHKSGHPLQELLDVKQMLLMLGVETFYREVPASPVVEDLFHDHPEPELLLNLMDPELARSPRVRNVMLAVRLARHSANGWHDAALPHDYIEIADLLHMEPNKVMSMVRTGPGTALH